VLYGATAAVLFWILRLQYALFLGIAAGVFYAVPYVGPGLSMVSVIVIALTMGKGIGYAVLAVVVFLLMHLAYDYGVTPRVVGGSVGLHPLVNIFALMCGVTLFGVWGMILAVPVAASLQKILVHFFPWLIAPPEPEASGQENPSPS
jgi:predicted PurR-regulated permease PerM